MRITLVMYSKKCRLLFTICIRCIYLHWHGWSCSAPVLFAVCISFESVFDLPSWKMNAEFTYWWSWWKLIFEEKNWSFCFWLKFLVKLIGGIVDQGQKLIWCISCSCNAQSYLGRLFLVMDGDINAIPLSLFLTLWPKIIWMRREKISYSKTSLIKAKFGVFKLWEVSFIRRPFHMIKP